MCILIKSDSWLMYENLFNTGYDNISISNIPGFILLITEGTCRIEVKYAVILFPASLSLATTVYHKIIKLCNFKIKLFYLFIYSKSMTLIDEIVDNLSTFYKTITQAKMEPLLLANAIFVNN